MKMKLDDSKRIGFRLVETIRRQQHEIDRLHNKTEAQDENERKYLAEISKLRANNQLAENDLSGMKAKELSLELENRKLKEEIILHRQEFELRQRSEQSNRSLRIYVSRLETELQISEKISNEHLNEKQIFIEKLALKSAELNQSKKSLKKAAIMLKQCENHWKAHEERQKLINQEQFAEMQTLRLCGTNQNFNTLIPYYSEIN